MQGMTDEYMIMPDDDLKKIYLSYIKMSKYI